MVRSSVFSRCAGIGRECRFVLAGKLAAKPCLYVWGLLVLELTFYIHSRYGV